jgi:hypothetical protein
MSDKKIPVMVGDIEVGRAIVDKLSDGTIIIHISIDDVEWGGWSIGGFFPLRLTGIIPFNCRERKMNEDDKLLKELKDAIETNEGADITQAAEKAKKALEDK